MNYVIVKIDISQLLLALPVNRTGLVKFEKEVFYVTFNKRRGIGTEREKLETHKVGEGAEDLKKEKKMVQL